MHLAVADISIVPLFADRITSAHALGGALRFMGPLAEKPTRCGMSAFGGKADIAIARQNVRF